MASFTVVTVARMLNEVAEGRLELGMRTSISIGRINPRKYGRRDTGFTEDRILLGRLDPG